MARLPQAVKRDGKRPAFPLWFWPQLHPLPLRQLELARNQLGASKTLKVSLDVSNVGAHPGEEVVQLYVSPLGQQWSGPPKELRRSPEFLQPGETKTVHFGVPIQRLAYYDETRADFVVEPLEYEVFAGAHSLDPHAVKRAVCGSQRIVISRWLEQSFRTNLEGNFVEAWFAESRGQCEG